MTRKSSQGVQKNTVITPIRRKRNGIRSQLFSTRRRPGLSRPAASIAYEWLPIKIGAAPPKTKQDALQGRKPPKKRKDLNKEALDFGSSGVVASIKQLIHDCRTVDKRNVRPMEEDAAAMYGKIPDSNTIEHKPLEIFIRRFYIHKLFKSSSRCSTRVNDPFVNSSQTTMSSSDKRTGNPENAKAKEDIDNMVDAIFPPSEGEHDKHRNIVKKLRLEGQCLDLLVTEFGLGILLLIPYGLELANFGLNNLNRLIDVLKKNGDASKLCKFSSHVYQALSSLFPDTPGELKTLYIECVDDEEIKEHPRLCENLFILFKEVSTDPIFREEYV